jgi:hypothetical protein
LCYHYTIGQKKFSAGMRGTRPCFAEASRNANYLPHWGFAQAGRAMRSSQGEAWSRRWDSNPQPPVYKTGALPLSYAGF